MSFADIAGGRVQLGHFYNQHGPMAFRGAIAASAWTRATGVVERRCNVIQLRWQEGLDRAPRRGEVVDMVLALGFKVAEIFAIIHSLNSSEYDISFMTPILMESFLSRYEVVRGHPSWKSFRMIPLSHQDEVKKVTILFRNESVPAEDIVTWLGKFGQVMPPPPKKAPQNWPL